MSKNNNVEIIGEYKEGVIATLPFGTKTITPEQQKQIDEYNKKRDLRGKDERGNFVLLNLEYARVKLQEVGYLELGYVMLLLSHIQYFRESKLVLPLGTERHPMTLEKLESIWNLKHDTVRKKVSKLVSTGILLYTAHPLDKRKKVINLHPTFAVKGEDTRDYKQYTKVYQEQFKSLIALISNKKDSAITCGLLLCLLSKMNRNTQMLVEQEHEKLILHGETIDEFIKRFNNKCGKSITLKTIRQLTGITDNRSIKKPLVLLETVGAIKQVFISNKKVLFVNPTLAYKNDNARRDIYEFVKQNYFADALISENIKINILN